MLIFPISETIKEFSSFFNKKGFELYIVGGAVRDFLLGTENDDFDFCTDAKPEEVIGIFKNVIPTGIKHGTVTVLFKGNSFEVTTFRTEGNYTDFRHPDSVQYVRKLKEDLSRRDFTVNALAANCRDGKIIDMFNGIKDLKRGTIRAIGNPSERFTEDALRMLRMCRFCSKLSFEPSRKTVKAAAKLSENIKYVSEERIFDEISKLLMSDNPVKGLELSQTTGILKQILPELDICKTIPQSKVGSNNVLEHIFNSVEEASKRNYPLQIRWALLLHDIGKPVCVKKVGEFIRFFGHDQVSAQIALTVMKRLKFSNQMIDEINILISNHMVKYNKNWSDGAIKRFINRVGVSYIDDLFKVQWCDQVASEGNSREKDYIEFKERIDECLNQPLTVKDLAVNGSDLASIGIPKSKEMGLILNELLEMVIDYPSLNQKDILLEQSETLFKTKFCPS